MDRYPTRDELIEKHIGLVKSIATQMARKLPEWEHEDLESYGFFGLIDAAERFDAGSFDPERGTTMDSYFESFATPRVRGAIMDGLRGRDWAPRSVRSSARAVTRATEALENRLGRTPSVAELAEELEMTEEEVRDAQRDAHESYVQALEHQRDSEEAGPAEYHPAHLPSSDIAGDVDQMRLRRLMSEAIVGLPAEHRMVVALKYGERLKLPEIGQRLGCGRGKATALYVEACMMLRERLAVLT